MSSKIEVSRELGEQILSELTSGAVSVATGAKLHALLAAPVVERQPVSYQYSHVDRFEKPMFGGEWFDCSAGLHDEYATDPFQYRVRKLYTTPPELAELQATIERQGQCISGLSDELIEARSEIDRLKGGQV